MTNQPGVSFKTYLIIHCKYGQFIQCQLCLTKVIKKLYKIKFLAQKLKKKKHRNVYVPPSSFTTFCVPFTIYEGPEKILNA